MKRTVAVLGLAAVVAAAATPQTTPPRRYTAPRLPPAEVLDRLSLTLAWSNRLPTKGSEDGLFSVQLLPAGGREELLVQSRLGVVFLLDAETGDVLWRTPVGPPYVKMSAAAFNDEDIYVLRREMLYVLDRRTGRQRLYTVDPGDGHVTYGFNLGTGITAAPSADREQIYLCQDESIGSYLVPRFAVTEAPVPGAPAPPPKAAGKPGPAAPGGGAPPAAKAPPGKSSAQPVWAWGALTTGIPLGVPLPFAPVVVGNTVNVVGSQGTVISMDKVKAEERYRYRLYGAVAAPMGNWGTVLYVGSEDHRVYALDAETKELYWRFNAGAPVTRQPWATDGDVYVSTFRVGLFRVDRDSGEPVWLNKRAVRFLAANQKLVYAADRDGKLLVLDLARGRTLADYDLSDYTVRVSNEMTDRVFLGAHDGTLICLHHRDNRVPYRTRALPKPPPPKVGKEKVGEKEPAPEAKEEAKQPPEKAEEPKKEAPAKEELKKEEPKKEELKKEDLKKEELKKDKAKEEKPGRALPGRDFPARWRPALARGEGRGLPGEDRRRWRALQAPSRLSGRSRLCFAFFLLASPARSARAGAASAPFTGLAAQRW
jgi:outer membrane protein assembly factor BamB